jgi:hypothetical protein
METSCKWPIFFDLLGLGREGKTLSLLTFWLHSSAADQIV